MRELVERFENAYSTLEERIRENYGPFSSSSPVYWWEREMLNGSERTRMKMLRELRNLYAHNPTFRKGIEVAYPTEDAIAFLLAEIERAGMPDNLSSRMIPIQKVLVARMDDLVWPVIFKMNQSGFSSVPIVDRGNRVIGVLSESLIVSLLVKHKALCFSELLKFEDLGNEVLFSCSLGLDNHIFVSPVLMSLEAENQLASSWKKGRRVDILLVTAGARQDRPLLGILTPHDLFRNSRLS